MPVTLRSLLVRQVSGAGKKAPTNLRYDPTKKQTVNLSCDCRIGPTPIIVGVGVGDNTLLYSQDDGLTWTGLGNSIFELEGKCAVWNGNIWVAGGFGNTNTNPVAYSSDGINWTGVGAITTGPSSNVTSCSSLVWTGSYFVGVFYDNIIRSTNGIVWEGLTGITQGQSLEKLATNGSIIIATTLYPQSFNVLLKSNSDGGSFTQVSISQIPGDRMIQFTDILWDGNRFIVTVWDRTDPLSNPASPPLTFSKMYSPDGLTWTPILNVAYTNGYNIGFKDSSSLYISRGIAPDSTERSTDGINWSTVSDPVLDAFVFNQGGKGIIFSSQKYIFICGITASNNFIYSTNGLAWTQSSTNVPGKFNSGFSISPLPA
jgi:hypothetical protein